MIPTPKKKLALVYTRNAREPSSNTVLRDPTWANIHRKMKTLPMSPSYHRRSRSSENE
ncbi:hypothetical protein P7K49_009844 [Saguinus oedipus]|uniref:Uncharacterized protein n=1 Tax=Saguinus oedipus TaxID=9490 RepID=A0ABQ9VL46_SAGOE|nr:hypothetical protein P7K49_009844 [Saguinus oedipus]